jgi:hypothetical protein
VLLAELRIIQYKFYGFLIIARRKLEFKLLHFDEAIQATIPTKSKLKLAFDC